MRIDVSVPHCLDWDALEAEDEGYSESAEGEKSNESISKPVLRQGLPPPTL